MTYREALNMFDIVNFVVVVCTFVDGFPGLSAGKESAYNAGDPD